MTKSKVLVEAPDGFIVLLSEKAPDSYNAVFGDENAPLSSENAFFRQDIDWKSNR